MTQQEQAIRDAIDTEVVASHEAGRWATRCGYLLSLLDRARRERALLATLTEATDAHRAAASRSMHHPGSAVDAEFERTEMALIEALVAAMDHLRRTPPSSAPLPASPPLAPVESGDRAKTMTEWVERVAYEAYHLGQPTYAWEAGDAANAIDRAGPPPSSCPPPSPAEGSERARKIEAAARAYRTVICNEAEATAREGFRESWLSDARRTAGDALDLALALPAGPPESDAVYREVAEAVRDACVATFPITPGSTLPWTRDLDLPGLIARVLARRGR